jgi:hypothetical protein
VGEIAKPGVTDDVATLQLTAEEGERFANPIQKKWSTRDGREVDHLAIEDQTDAGESS